jgi:hypothetical protein
MPKAILFAAAAISLWPTVAGAVDTSNFILRNTADLYAVCSTPANDPLRPQAINFCEGFLLGVVTYDEAIADNKHLKRFICYPPTATRDEGIQAFVGWAASHKQDSKLMEGSALVGAIRGLAAKWPCKE